MAHQIEPHPLHSLGLVLLLDPLAFVLQVIHLHGELLGQRSQVQTTSFLVVVGFPVGQRARLGLDRQPPLPKVDAIVE